MNENEKLFDLLVKESVDRLDPPPDEELEMTAEELEIMEKQRKAAYKYVQKEIGRKKHSPHTKKIVLLAACLTAVLALAMNASALRIALYKTYTEVKGLSLKVDTVKLEEKSLDDIKEYAYMDSVIVPTWLPDKAILTKITESEDFLSLMYRSPVSDFAISIRQGIVPTASDDNISIDNNTYAVSEITVMGEPATLIKLTSELGVTTYDVIWTVGDIRYDISAWCNKKTLDVILKNLAYCTKK